MTSLILIPPVSRNWSDELRVTWIPPLHDNSQNYWQARAGFREQINQELPIDPAAPTFFRANAARKQIKVPDLTNDDKHYRIGFF